MNKQEFSNPSHESHLYKYEHSFPGGTLILIANNKELLMADWKDSKRYETHLKKLMHCGTEIISGPTNPIIEKAVNEIKLYLNGELKKFSVPVNPAGTPFQILVWNYLNEIPYGELKSYEAIAENLGDKRKSRAVANAIAENPISILIPCHRVIRKNGTLGGYAGGKKCKELLLALENKFKNINSEDKQQIVV